MGDLSRLPKWAQEQITSLERSLDQANAYIERLSNQNGDSNVKVTSYGVHPDVSMPHDSVVDFYLGGNRDKYGQTIEVRHKRQDPSVLHVSGNYGRLLVCPVVSNVVEIRLEDF